jgi:hypothetical protein
MKSALSFELYLVDRIDRWEARRRLATTRPSEAHTPKSITRHRFESRPARGDWISVSPPQHTRPPLVAGNGAPLISGCAATRGAAQRGVAMDTAGWDPHYPLSLQPREPDRRAGTTTRRPLHRRKHGSAARHPGCSSRRVKRLWSAACGPARSRRRTRCAARREYYSAAGLS